MGDLISRSAALDSLQELLGQEVVGSGYGISDVGVGIKISMNLAKSAPAVDAVPVVHARWIYRDMWYTDMQCDCSACGAKLHVPTCMGKPMYKYCPDCGARMDAKEEK